jgi:hypothetical protein
VTEPRPEPDAEDVPAWLYGRWRLLRSDPSLDFAPGVQMEFRKHGQLHYGITVDGYTQVIPLLYRVAGDVLLTDNPAAPHATSTHFSLGAGDVLIFDFAGAQAVFVRES